ncbi:hypothetical protein HK097_006549, partial [Rhizophlyctis rosea]
EGREELVGMVVEFGVEDFRGRMDILTSLLFTLYRQDQLLSRAHPTTYKTLYPTYFHRILTSVSHTTSSSTPLDPKDRTFTRFLLEVPEITEDCINFLRRFCDDPERMQLGLGTVRDLIKGRPASREGCLRVLEEFCLSPVKATRSTAIVIARRFFAENKAIAVRIEGFARGSVGRLAGEPPSGPPVSVDGEDLKLDENGEVVKAEEDSVVVDEDGEDGKKVEEGGGGGENGEKDKADKGREWKEEDVVRHLEVFLAVCSRKHELLVHLFTLYPAYHPSVQRVVRSAIQPLIKIIGPRSPTLLNLFKTYPEGSESLLLRILGVLTDRDVPSRELVDAVLE